MDVLSRLLLRTDVLTPFVAAGSNVCVLPHILNDFSRSWLMRWLSHLRIGFRCPHMYTAATANRSFDNSKLDTVSRNFRYSLPLALCTNFEASDDLLSRPAFLVPRSPQAMRFVQSTATSAVDADFPMASFSNASVKQKPRLGVLMTTEKLKVPCPDSG